MPIPFQFPPLYSSQENFVRSYMLYNGFPHMLDSDYVFVGDVKDLNSSDWILNCSSAVSVSKSHVHTGILL